MRILPLFLAALLAAAGPLHAAPIEVHHAQGTATLEGTPARTVVFDLATLDNMHALGIEAQAVPDARFPEHLAHYADARFPKVGSLFEPDLEAVRALEPDLIIVGDRSTPAFEALSQIAPTIDLTPAADDFFDDVASGIETLGRIYGRDQQAAALAGELRALREQVATQAEGLDAVMLFALNGNASPHAPGARFGTPLDALGIGFFTVVGVQKSLQYDSSAIAAVVLGMFSAVMGGVTRDTLMNETPLIFRKEIYATACLAGSILFVISHQLGLDNNTNAFISVTTVVVIRVLAVRYKLHLPVIGG